MDMRELFLMEEVKKFVGIVIPSTGMTLPNGNKEFYAVPAAATYAVLRVFNRKGYVKVNAKHGKKIVGKNVSPIDMHAYLLGIVEGHPVVNVRVEISEMVVRIALEDHNIYIWVDIEDISFPSAGGVTNG